MAERSLKWLSDLFGRRVDEPKVERSIGPIYPTPDGRPISSSALDATRLQAVKNWSHPFKQKSKVSVIDQLTQLSNATAGYYPLGAGGLWHGGVHFDSGTAGVLDQSSVVCIADGEVVAYRTDMNSTVTSYIQNKKRIPRPFSRNFVLIRHRLEPPIIQGNNSAPPSLIIYSLYMHLQEGAVYQNTPTLARPGFWEKKEDYVVPMTAKDADPNQTGRLGLNVRHQEKGGAVIGLLPHGTLVKVSKGGQYRRLENMEGPAQFVGADGTLLGYVRFDQLEPLEGGEYRAKAGLTIYDETNSKPSVRKPGLPKGTQVKISGEGEFRKLESIAQFVHFDSLQALPVPRKYDEVCVLDKPVPIKAGALIGHVGQYQDYAAAHPEKKLHLEVFSDGDVECFIAQCRSWEKGLPANDKTWLKLAKGTVVVAHKDHFGEKRPPTQSDERQLSDADLSVPKSLLDGLPSTHKITVSEAGGRKACTWYRLEGLLNDEKNQLLDGWVRLEKGVEQWTSPWAWEGYEIITDYTAPPEFLAASLRSLKRLTDEQLKRYGPVADAGDKGPIKERLFDLIDRDGDRNITAEELRTIMQIPAHAQAISRLIIYCESEWYYRPKKWDALDEILGHAGSTPHLNWLAEKERIKELSWWEDIAEQVGFGAAGSAWVSHWHPMGLIARLSREDPEVITYRVCHSGKIEKTVLAGEVLPCNACYIYVDELGVEHDFGRFEGVRAKRWLRKGIISSEDLYLIDASDLGRRSNRFGFRFTGTKRTYLSQSALASLIGVLMDLGYPDIISTGFSAFDGSPGVSASHINGENGDFRFLRVDGRWEVPTYLNTAQGVQALDEFRQARMIDALHKFGWGQFLAWRYEKEGAFKLLPRTRHYENHHHHLHVGKYLPSLIEVVS